MMLFQEGIPVMGILDTLMELLETPSVCGHTEEVMGILREKFKSIGIDTTDLRKGGLIAVIPGSSSEGTVLSAHLDTLGAMVSGIEDDGRIRFKNIGSFTMPSIEGEYCTIETWDNDLIEGTALFDSTSVHIHGLEKASVKREQENMYVRVDIEANSRQEILDSSISIGNYIHFHPRPVLCASGFIKSRHLDDKAGAAVLVELAETLIRQGKIPQRTLYLLFTSYEEVGHGAAVPIPEDVTEFIAVDMGVAGPGRESSEYKVTICAADSTGPFSYQLTKRLIDAAKRRSIPYCVDTFPHYGSDATVALRTGLDVRHGLIGPGVDSSHAAERTHEKALAATLQLLMEYVTNSD